MDRFSPVAPAQIRVLVLPVGQIERSRYIAFLDRLKSEGSVIRLSELESINGDNDALLSSKTFPQGSIIYNYTVSAPSEQQQQLSPFELFREPLLVLGVKDGFKNDREDDQNEVQAAAEYIRRRYPSVVHRQLLVLQDGEGNDDRITSNVIAVRNVAHIRDPSLRQAVCRFSARFLAELSTYLQAIQASPSLQTPGQTAKRLQRTTSLRERERQSISGYKTPPQSMEITRTVEAPDEARPESEPVNQSPPPTSFDQMTNNNGTNSRPGRPDSRASNKSRSSIRASSQDRVSTQGFGSSTGTSQEKTKSRGRARVGIVVGFLYLMAGHWNDALKLLVEHTSKARILADLLWHGKGLEGIIVCLLLHAWAGLEFQIPSICYPTGGRPHSVINGESSSVDSEVQPRLLSACLPDLLKFTLALYYSSEGSLELPFVAVAEVTIRFCKLLAVLRNAGGQINHDILEDFIKPGIKHPVGSNTKANVRSFARPAKGAIADMLSNADPAGEDNVAVADQAAILAGIASVYALLDMNRKKAATIKDLLTKLTVALVQARKRGAAEMGIHPAASLSADTGANTVLSIAEENGGLGQVMSDVAAIYGLHLGESSKETSDTNAFRHFGNDNLKLAFIRALASFCEVSPDPHGLLQINASALRAFGPNAAVDAEPFTRSISLSKDEQVRCFASIKRNIGILQDLGLPKIEADYWDDYLVRDVEFVPAESSQAVAELSKLKQGQSVEHTSGNPLLYDPHENRPTAGDASQTYVLVPNEISVCRITLQNPYDITLDVESIQLITEGVQLKASHQHFTVAPFGIQRVSISVSPSTPGDCKITGCLIKIHGCREQQFRIVSKPWSASIPFLMKVPNEDRKVEDSSKEKPVVGGPEYSTIAVTVIEPQPRIVLDESSMVDSTLMLLDGEALEMKLTIRNLSDIAASIFDVVTTNDAIQLSQDYEDDESLSESSEQAGMTIVEPGKTATFTFDVTGKPSVFQVKIAFHYGCHENATHARILEVPINMTVNAGLQIQRLEALPMDIAENGEYSFVFTLDVGNAWPKSIFYSCFVSDLGLKSAEPRRCHNHEGVLAPGQFERVFMPVARPVLLHESDENLENARKSLLERLRIIWQVEGEERMGDVAVSSLTMNTDALKIVAGEAIIVSLELAEVEGEAPSGSKTVVKAGSFATLRAKLSNRASRAYPLVCQMQSRTLDSAQYAQNEQQVAVVGAQHRFVPPIARGESATIDFAFCPLLPGPVELDVLVRAALLQDESGSQWTSHRRLLLTVT